MPDTSAPKVAPQAESTKVVRVWFQLVPNDVFPKYSPFYKGKLVAASARLRSYGLIVTEVGEYRLVVSPTPKVALLFCPQHFTELSAMITQVCQASTSSSLATRPAPRSTRCGVAKLVVLPNPGWP